MKALYCPVCGRLFKKKKLLLYYDDFTELKVFCRGCKNEILIKKERSESNGNDC